MSRAAFLPTPGDPFLLNLWFSFYPRWCNEIDRLYVYLNTDSPPEVVQYIEQLVKANPKTFFIHFPKQIEHGEALKQMVKLATEDLIMFIEDDAFVFKGGAVEKCFGLIENDQFDAIGSKRGSCSELIYKEASRIWEIDNTGFGDTGPNFWPNFFFAKRTDLLKVSNFASKSWQKGEKVVQLDNLVAPELLVGDTFVEGSLEMRALGLRFGYVPQLHGNTDDEPDYMKKEGIWGPEGYWLHVGSLSSGFGGMLRPDYKLDREHFNTENEKLELERRLVFYKWSLDLAVETPGIPKVKKQYSEGIDRLMRVYDLNESRIRRRLNWYKEAML